MRYMGGTNSAYIIETHIGSQKIDGQLPDK